LLLTIVLSNKSNFDSKTNSNYSYKNILSQSKSNFEPINLKRNLNKILSPKNKEKAILMKSSNSILLTRKFLSSNEEKTAFDEKCLTDNPDSNLKGGNSNVYMISLKREESSEDIKEKVCKIFNNFAKFSKEENKFVLSNQALIKILRFVNLLDDKHLKLSDIDLILKKVSPKSVKLDQDSFLDFIAQLAFKLNSKSFTIDPKTTILGIIKTYFDHFVDSLDKPMHDTEENEFISSTHVKMTIPSFIEKFEIQSEMIILISSIYNGLKEVYQQYFSYEVNDYGSIEQIKKESINSFIGFCRDYEITPYLLNMNQLACYWNQVNTEQKINTSLFDQKKELGKMFTLSKFGMMLLHFGIMTFSKFNQGSLDYPDSGIFLIILRKDHLFP
jgi:hypothetical protein